MEPELKQFGLTGNEAKVYLELLKREQISVGEFSKKISLDRSATYHILGNLIEKGLVNYVIKNGKKFFSSADPENLLVQIKEKEELLKTIIPKLKKIQQIPEVKRNVEVYEGKEGLKSFTHHLLKYDNFYILNATGKIFEALRYFWPRIIKDMNKKPKIKIIAAEAAKKTELVKLKPKIRFLPKEFSNNATTFIYGNKVAFQIIVEKPFIVITENEYIAEGYKKNFEFMWKFCKE